MRIEVQMVVFCKSALSFGLTCGLLLLLGMRAEADTTSIFGTGDDKKIDEFLKKYKDKRSPDIKKAEKFIASFVCDAPTREFDRIPPEPQLSGFESIKNEFAGSTERWVFDEDHTYIFHNVFNDFKADKSYYYRSEANYRDLNPNIKVDGNKMRVECTNSACFMVHQSYHDGAHFGEININDVFPLDDSPTTSQTYKFCTSERAERIAKALSFLISQNGGKESPF
ncbi:hypothetical protein NKH70_22870 [Mesorhizobium sp. M0991]|uniref:hypothetical protein n=1 Tax=Mesorhizobium sp. M0991 TaxID=2957043 RepID=UPI00333654C0